MELIALGLGLGAGIAGTVLFRRHRARPPRHGTEEIDRRLATVDRIEARFFANVAHEFRTPLTLILGNLERLENDGARAEPGSPTEDNSWELQVALRNARRLHRLVDQLLELSRLEAHRLELNALVADVTPFVRVLAATFDSLADRKGVELRFEAPEQPVPVRFEPDKLEKIVSNLIFNAIKFTTDGHIDVRVRLEGQSSGEVAIEVEDTGVGIPADRLPHVFDPYFQVPSDDPRRYEGSGIGLALARELVQLHGGRIDVSSDEGMGARFTVRMPLASGDVVDAPAGRRPPWMPTEGPVALATLQTLRDTWRAEPSDDSLVLVVDEHPEMRRYVARCLREEHRIVEAESGAQALELAREVVPDLIVTDLVMPGMTGLELTRRLRDDTAISHVPVIMLTAAVDEESRLEGLDAGVDDYVTKPFSERELRGRVANLLEIRSILRERFEGVTVIRPSEIDVTPVDQRFLESVLAVVEAHISDPDLQVADLAAAVHLSESQLTRKLKAVTGQTPGRLVRGVRLQRGADLLDQRGGSVGRIAYEVGFSDQAHFSRAFRKLFGMPPSRWAHRSGRSAGSADAPEPEPDHGEPGD